MKKIIFGLALLIAGLSVQNVAHGQYSCDEASYEIAGFENIKQNQIVEYTIIATEEQEIALEKAITFRLFKNSSLIERVRGDKYFHNFLGKGTYTLNADFMDEKNCSYSLSKTISVYEKSLVYIGDPLDEFTTGFQDNFKENDILFDHILLPEKSTFSEDEIVSILSTHIDFLKTADWIVLNDSDFDIVLQVISKINSNTNLELGKKEFFVVSDANKNFIKRIISKYIKHLGIKELSVLETDYAPLLLSSISFNQNVHDQQYIKSFSLVFEEMPKYYPISYLVDYLISKGFPINLISLLLILCVSALLISVFRQIIGFSVFGIYSPLLFTVSIFVLDVKSVFFLFVIAFIATFLTRLFTKRFHLLYSAKISLLVILYFFLTIVILGLDAAIGTNLIDISIFSNTFIIFPIMILILVTDKIFNEGFKLFSKGRWISFAEFVVISFCIYMLISWTGFKHLLLSYPELIILALILNIVVGRFTGLQLLEYLRFMPLIKKHLEGEEE